MRPLLSQLVRFYLKKWRLEQKRFSHHKFWQQQRKDGSNCKTVSNEMSSEVSLFFLFMFIFLTILLYILCISHYLVPRHSTKCQICQMASSKLCLHKELRMPWLVTVVGTWVILTLSSIVFLLIGIWKFVVAPTLHFLSWLKKASHLLYALQQ